MCGKSQNTMNASRVREVSMPGTDDTNEIIDAEGRVTLLAAHGKKEWASRDVYLQP